MRNSHMEEVQPLRKADASGEDVSVPPASMAQEQSWRCGSVVDITITVGVCVLYTLVGPLLILNNKYLLTSGFPYPIVLTSLTQAATVVFAVAAALLSRMRCIEWEMPRREFDGTLIRASVVVGFAAATCLCAGNSAYLYLSVSFIEILKGYAPLVTMMMQGFFGIGYPERKPVLAVLASCVGTTIASAGEVHASPVGLLIFFSSMYFEATRLILTQKLLGQYKMHVVEALLYISPATFVFTAAAAATIELPRFKPGDIRNPPIEPFWVGIGLTCLLGCLINLSSFLVIQRTNVVMLKLLSISRNAGVVVSGVVLFGEACGYVITLIFFVVYNYLQITAAQAAARAKAWEEGRSLDGHPPDSPRSPPP
ncbi:hypothetical protein EMIHUDRAFT_463785 [Emiliania huxleyi CCMP1516]|uniref:Sugar phosphate transporter domain-containing protein n=2 Tax=Emiliania huxleyi TaxID=2903 RepID=A0A0D3JBM6_EMIH1|nr:hypothetical protein EMIHUDRAFT_463785 [Emiliania huxleyi CCMP1516]EOD20911.1 hypothetical protein EMIHUDRAFT_463785 [Emiliania huxleyi CCMP1516]|eukprot:XP_005773340.1 hypothetical protein EMIHUDRAFT_463785 [Emiliania huxleyi CCMP1516]